ncbi:MAG: hypothetical protein ACOC85_01600 [Thermoplasmatota archaeon]
MDEEVEGMSLKKGYVLMSYEEDIENKGMSEWKEGSPTVNTLKRYEGELTLFEDELVFEGIDNEAKQDFTLKISPYDVEEISLGFDDTFQERENEENSYLEPLRITFFKEGIEYVIYILAEFDPVVKTDETEGWYEDLKDWYECKIYNGG